MGSPRPGLMKTVPRGSPWAAAPPVGTQYPSRKRNPPAPRYHSPAPPGGHIASGMDIKGAWVERAAMRLT
ncbi:hypothetical protein GCM10011273_20280 [Asticcacaulis endophyticus]|uniref:Uncharacterized protein n=1 Tax=Asticcacaulis endophyticus TaxID=1395890 RepID=A0A918Q6L2_9CAUL|nr:hypothetical protein GCM10011273_20280 [Asticcacaulis endophyticus]